MVALKPEELPEFLLRLDDYQGHRLTYLGMCFVIYTSGPGIYVKQTGRSSIYFNDPIIALFKKL